MAKRRLKAPSMNFYWGERPPFVKPGKRMKTGRSGIRQGRTYFVSFAEERGRAVSGTIMATRIKGAGRRIDAKGSRIVR